VTYEKIFISKFEERGGLNKIPSQALEIKILKKTGEFPTKLSIELKKPAIKGEEGKPRSFRTSSQITIENIIASLSRALGYFLSEKGRFSDPFTEKIDKANLELKVNDELKHLFAKIKESFMDGVREFEEKGE